jgi:aromatic-L-amino-acid decarboxylase
MSEQESTTLEKDLVDAIAAHRELYLKDPEKAHVWDASVAGVPGMVNTLLLTTIGRRSGRRRSNPLSYIEVDGNFVVVASKGGLPAHPAWYLNLVANPRCEIQVGADQYQVVARTAQNEERETLWKKMLEYIGRFAEYQRRTERIIPVVVLEPLEREAGTGQRSSVKSAARSETRRLDTFLQRLAPALETFLRSSPGDPLPRRHTWAAALERPLPEHGVGADAVVEELIATVIPNGCRLSEPGFWGWITVGPDTVPTVASLAATVASPQRYTLTAFNRLEELSLDWLAELCGLQPDMKGVYSSGGSVANLVALGAARQWALEQRGIDAGAAGVGPTRMAVYASREAHRTIQRSAGVLGLGRASVRAIPTDDRQRLDVAALRRALDEDVRAGVVPVAVVATAGTTNTGAIDPLRAAGELAREAGAWFHVDGAYGLPGVLDDRVSGLYDGLELADSVIVDPHKWLGAPVGIAATFVRDRAILHRAFTQEPAPYLEESFADAADAVVSLDSMGVPYADFGVELSSPARGVVVWSILRELGREGVRARVRRDNDLARHLAARVAADERLELLAEPVLSICCFRYKAPDVADLDRLNAAIVRRLVRETPYLPSSTVVGGRFAIRPCFINARTEIGHVDGLADAVVAIGDELRLRATVPS